MKAIASHDKKINMRNIKKHASPYKLTYESLFFKFLALRENSIMVFETQCCEHCVMNFFDKTELEYCEYLCPLK